MADLTEQDRAALHSMMDLGSAFKKMPAKAKREIQAWNRMVDTQAGMTNKDIRKQWRGKA